MNFILVNVYKEEYIFLWKQLNTSTGGAAFHAAESERLCSDPMNLLVNTSVGMWFAEYESNADNPYRRALLFLFFYFLAHLVRGRDQTGPNR